MCGLLLQAELSLLASVVGDEARSDEPPQLAFCFFFLLNKWPLLLLFCFRVFFLQASVRIFMKYMHDSLK